VSPRDSAAVVVGPELQLGEQIGKLLPLDRRPRVVKVAEQALAVDRPK
jgi:hypothetical protein